MNATKKTVLVAVLSLCIAGINAQTWAPVGAMWTFSNISFGLPSNNVPTTIVCTGDTIIGGKLCRIFEGGCNCMFINNGAQFLYYEDEKVYYYVDSVAGFTTLYDFSATTGDSWTCIIKQFGNYDTTVFVVAGIGEEIIDGDTIPVQFVHNQDEYGNWQWGGKVYKNIGDYYCFYPQFATADPWTGPIRCYEDSSTFIKFQPIACDSSIFWSSIEESNRENRISIFPIPAVDEVTVSIHHQNILEFDFVIYSSDGIQQMHSEGLKNNACIDISQLSPGLYFFQVFFGDSLTALKKVVVR